MIKLELFLILFTVDYLKEILIPETNKILKHPIGLGEFIQWMGCWFYMGVVPAPDGTIYLVDINETHYWGFLVWYMYWGQNYYF